MVVAAPIRAIHRHSLEPGSDLFPSGKGWIASATKVQFAVEADLAPGWYRLRLAIRSRDRFTIRKRAELSFEAAEPNAIPVAKDAIAWNQRLNESFLIELPRATKRVVLTLVHAEGEFEIPRFSMKRVPKPLVGLAALGEKFRLITAYKCLRPVLLRGGKMLLNGEFSKFGQKVLKGLGDSRTMRIGGYKSNEVDASWWRRHALSPEEAEPVRAAVDAMSNPEPIAVLMIVDPDKFDEARAAAHSVRRQLYPHWELLLACSGPPGLHPHLALIVGRDPRVKVCLVDEDDGAEAAVAQALAVTVCDRIAVLPPNVELAEHALFHFANELKLNPGLGAISAPIYDVLASGVSGEDAQRGHVWLTRTDRLKDELPAERNAETLAVWALGDTPSALRGELKTILAFPLEAAPLIDRARVGPKPVEPASQLILAANLLGITGWDHVCYAVLRGLPSAGAKFVRHPKASIRSDLIPPMFLPPLPRRIRPTDKQLAITPAFILHRFGPTESTAIYTMWETDKLTASDVKKLNLGGLVIVPSQWQVDCFRESGVTAPIRVAPLGYDQLVFNADGSFPEVCTFGTAGALVAGGMRKNAQKLIDLFRSAFPTQKDVRLRVKTSPASRMVELYDDPRIDLVRAVLPHKQLADWYRSLTAYVNGSYGEGFGLHLIEAMACGRPLITANYSGLTAYFDPSVGYEIDYKLVPVENDIYTGRWAEPSDDSIVEQMRRIYRNPEEARTLGAKCASRARNFTWKASGRQLVSALREFGFLADS